MISLITSSTSVKHIMTSPTKTITSVLMASTYIITTITCRPIGLAEILTIMSVSTFKTAVILFVSFETYNITDDVLGFTINVSLTLSPALIEYCWLDGGRVKP